MATARNQSKLFLKTKLSGMPTTLGLSERCPISFLEVVNGKKTLKISSSRHFKNPRPKPDD